MGEGCIKIYEALRMLYPFICFSSKQYVRDHLAVRWRRALAASDQTPLSNGSLTSLASVLHSTKKGLTMVSFSFPLHVPSHSSNYQFQNYGGSMPHHFYFLLPLLPFNSVFCVEEACFFPCVLWDICLFNNSLRDTLSVIQVLSAWGQGALISVSPFLTHLCAGLHIVMSKDTLQPFLSPLIFIWHCSGHGRCKYMR